MKKIVFDQPHRKKHFEFFNGMNHPHFNICANIDVSSFLDHVKGNGLPLTYCLVHAIASVANNIKEIRWRIRDGEVVEHQAVHPSFTVPNEQTDVFSFCTVPYDADRKAFLQSAEVVRERMKTDPSIEDEPGRDDYLFLSAIPWVSFTSMQHAMSYHPHDSVPRISWGKFFEQQGNTLMPLSVQAHHALVDGRHMGKYFEDIQEYINNTIK